MLSRSKKKELFIVLIIVLAGFLFRLYASFAVPVNYDEEEKVIFSKEINLNIGNLHLPFGSRTTHNPPLLPYLVKFSILLFGENTLAKRLPSVILGTLTLVILYLLVKENLSQKIALVSLTFVSFSQFHIGITRIAWEDGVMLFFAVCVIFFIQKALNLHEKNFLWLAGLFLGSGFLAKETIITILPVAIYYLFMYKGNKKIFSIQDAFIFILIVAIVISPRLYWNIGDYFQDYRSYLNRTDFLSFSLAPFVIFLGEMIILGMRDFSDHFIRTACSMEHPFLHWPMGLICIAGAVYFLRKRKNNFIVLLLILFYFNFLLYSFIRPKTGGGLYFHFDNFWWAMITVLPGFILGSAMLVDLGIRYRIVKFILPFLCCYFIINSIHFINFPANCFIPRESIKVEDLRNTAMRYLKEGKMDKALKVQNYMKKYYANYFKSY